MNRPTTIHDLVADLKISATTVVRGTVRSESAPGRAAIENEAGTTSPLK